MTLALIHSTFPTRPVDIPRHPPILMGLCVFSISSGPPAYCCAAGLGLLLMSCSTKQVGTGATITKVNPYHLTDAFDAHPRR